MSESYRNVIIGSGEAGKYLAWHLARQGQKTALVERKWIGGQCPNVNCLPSKNEVWSAKVAHMARHGGEFGVMMPSMRVDMAKVRERKREMVKALVEMHLKRFKESGTDLIMGSARFLSPRDVEVRTGAGETRILVGERMFLNVGSRALIPNVPGLAAADPLTNIEALELDLLPEHLITIGGSYVGLELSQAYRRFGSRVTVIEQGPRLAGREDPDVSEAIGDILRNEGLEILVSATPLGVEGRSGTSVTLRVQSPAGERTITGTHLLVAVGRTPNTNDMALELAGVELDERGYAVVNDRLQTRAPSIWAMGDCAGSPQFTHISLDDFRVVRDNLDGKDRRTTGRLVPYCMFTDPPLARVGLTETEAAQQGTPVRTAKIPMRAVLRTWTINETDGFMKAVVSAEDDRILGFTMIGSEAGEVMAVVEAAIMAELPYPRLAEAVLAHPTMAEGLGQLFSNVPKRA